MAHFNIVLLSLFLIAVAPLNLRPPPSHQFDRTKPFVLLDHEGKNYFVFPTYVGAPKGYAEIALNPSEGTVITVDSDNNVHLPDEALLGGNLNDIILRGETSEIYT